MPKHAYDIVLVQLNGGKVTSNIIRTHIIFQILTVTKLRHKEEYMFR